MNKHEMRKAAIERLCGKTRRHPVGLDSDDIVEALVGADYTVTTLYDDVETIIDLLSDDEPFTLPDDVATYLGDEFAKGPRDADGVLWFSGDMSDSEWGVIERIFYDCTRRQWLVLGHDISAPWIPADSIRHAPMRTATQREDDLIELLKDAARDYKADVWLWHGFAREQTEYIKRQTMVLPRDADGKVIHIGDELKWDDGERLTVEGIGNGILFYMDSDGCLQWTAAGNKHHYHKPTVDEILDELEGMRGTGDYDDVVERCADLAGMLRELLKEGEDE